MTKSCRPTIRAANIGYVVQAMINTFAPLLFVTFQTSYHITLAQVSVLIAANFGAQIVLDIFAAALADRIGYRPCVVAAQLLAAGGICALAVLPGLFAAPFIGLFIAVVIYGAGGGLTEVLLTPIVQACPIEGKDRAVSMLHSFYCWGGVTVILVSTAFFRLFGIENWRILAFIWAVIPVANAISFLRVPIYPFVEKERRMGFKGLASSGIFWLLMIFMFCAGACEMAVAQWASTFAEQGLRVTKAAGDLAGPCMFAVLKGAERLVYAKKGDKIPLWGFMLLCACLCGVCYLMIGLVAAPAVALVFCALAGLSNGVMWPGTFSLAAEALPGGGTALFGMLALCGDLGCGAGPLITGLVSSAAGGDLRAGFLFGTLFSLLMIAGLLILKKTRRPARKGGDNPEKRIGTS